MASGVHAQETDTIRIIETVRVSASAVDEDPGNLAASCSILQGQQWTLRIWLASYRCRDEA